MTVAEEWIERGWKKGWKEGWKEGWREGLREGKARALLIQIERQFGTEARAAYQARVEHASANEFEVWADRLLDAEQVEDLFREK